MSNKVNPTKVITGPETRWSYANVWEAKAINDGNGNEATVCILYQTRALLHKGTQSMIQID